MSCARQACPVLLFVIPVEMSIRRDMEARRGRVESDCRDPARVLPDQANYTVKDPGTQDDCDTMFSRLGSGPSGR
jgi:hypothetical protein